MSSKKKELRRILYEIITLLQKRYNVKTNDHISTDKYITISLKLNERVNISFDIMPAKFGAIITVDGITQIDIDDAESISSVLEVIETTYFSRI
jgi:TRAP-type mannitol/chloroaromatic compound transport system permease small subunit